MKPTVTRRRWMAAGLGWMAMPAGIPAFAAGGHAAAATALREGGGVLLLRHAATDPGIGDPPGFDLAVCSTQRNLSEAGRRQARRLGAWCAGQGLVPAAVRSSAWCRCLDTARLAFGQAEPWAPLNSFFEEPAREPPQTRALRTALGGIPAGRFEVWVTHMVNIAALCGENVPQGDALVVRAGTGTDPQPGVQTVARLALR